MRNTNPSRPRATTGDSRFARGVSLLVGTRKGLWYLHSDRDRQNWKLEGPQHLGQIVNHVVRDPRGKGTMLMAAKTGHLGPTIFRTTDKGKNWTEASVPPVFPAVAGPDGRAVSHTFWLTPGHESEPGVWWAGTSPPGLFTSEDDGVTWKSVAGFNENPMYSK